MAMKMSCLALDFDYTISHFTDDLRGLFEIFTRRGVPEKEARSAFTHVVEQVGFTFSAYSHAVQRAHRVNESEKILRAEFKNWLSSSLVLYPESLRMLRKWHNKIPVVIVTSGNPEFQREKIKTVGIPYDDVRFIQPPQRKVSVMPHLLKKYGVPVVFVDDNPRELDAVYQKSLQDKIITFLMRRPDSPYATAEPEYRHREIRSLDWQLLS